VRAGQQEACSITFLAEREKGKRRGGGRSYSFLAEKEEGKKVKIRSGEGEKRKKGVSPACSEGRRKGKEGKTPSLSSFTHGEGRRGGVALEEKGEKRRDTYSLFDRWEKIKGGGRMARLIILLGGKKREVGEGRGGARHSVSYRKKGGGGREKNFFNSSLLPERKRRGLYCKPPVIV